MVILVLNHIHNLCRPMLVQLITCVTNKTIFWRFLKFYPIKKMLAKSVVVSIIFFN